MGFLDDIYLTEETVSADFRNKTTTADAYGNVTESYSATTDLTINGLLWIGSTADKVVSEKIRPDVSAVFVFNYSDYTTIIEDNAKVTINSKDYSVIYIDNVANQNEVIQVPLKEFT